MDNLQYFNKFPGGHIPHAEDLWFQDTVKLIIFLTDTENNFVFVGTVSVR